MDGIVNGRSKYQPNDLFQKLPNMKYTVKEKPEKFLYISIVYNNDAIRTKVKRNERKLPVHWS